MGKLLKGINGPFSGKVGTAVGYMWKGIPVIRSKPKRRLKPFTPKELHQQAKFALMNKFLIGVKELLNITFAGVAVQMTGFNKAFSYNVKNAITGFQPDLAIDYSMVLLSRGDLPNIESVFVASISPGKLEFTWTDNSGKGKALATDKAFAAIYNEELFHWKYQMDLATRGAGKCKLNVQDALIGKPLHTYIGFISEDEKDVTDSIYTGLVNAG